MKVTGLRRSGNSDKIAVDLDGRFAFSVSLDALLELGIKPNTELSDFQYVQLKQRSHMEQAEGDAVKLLKYGPRTEQELRKKLMEKEYDEETAAAVVQKFAGLHLVDDLEYCHMFVRSHKETRGWGPEKTKQALLKKGLPAALSASVLSEFYDRDSTVELAVKAAEKKFRTLHKKNGNIFEIRLKLIRFLGSRGFDTEICRQAADQVISMIPEQE